MTSYPKHCDCIVCGKPKATFGYYDREDGRPVYVCHNCGRFFKLLNNYNYERNQSDRQTS